MDARLAKQRSQSSVFMKQKTLETFILYPKQCYVWLMRSAGVRNCLFLYALRWGIDCQVIKLTNSQGKGMVYT